MAMRRASAVNRMMEGCGRIPAAFRYLSDGKGRVLGEEEKAKENVYIQKMERERLEKLRQTALKEVAALDKETSDDKKSGEGSHKD